MVTITDVRAILTQPGTARLVVVKIQTSEPGLHGLGCATFTQRAFAVKTVIDRHLAPFLIGRDVNRIGEIWQMSMVNGYWRNGPVLNNAVSGVDQALWDIKGKRAGMPVYELFGGKNREAAAVYVHASGDDPHEVTDSVEELREQGYRHIRVQLGPYGGSAAPMPQPRNAPAGSYFDPRAYSASTLAMIDHVRETVGDRVELLHDIHERLHPIDHPQPLSVRSAGRSRHARPFRGMHRVHLVSRCTASAPPRTALRSRPPLRQAACVTARAMSPARPKRHRDARIRIRQQ
ncbi:hypothetical protein [Candidatus Poriferisodalis sp.]|uniref:hypothetical protein n=1 Tax=Candidatus Poriferisodalis sp. TaxID=3101277 RepID=UPI003B0265A5